jgi:hypothetical protein
VTPDPDPTQVIAYLVFLAAFAAGLELSQVTISRRRVGSRRPRTTVLVVSTFGLVIAALVLILVMTH